VAHSGGIERFANLDSLFSMPGLLHGKNHPAKQNGTVKAKQEVES
jgi:hypothetical protein